MTASHKLLVPAHVPPAHRASNHPLAVRMRSCEACGAEMDVRRQGARFCNATCRKRGQRARQSPREAYRRDLSVTGHRKCPSAHSRFRVTDNPLGLPPGIVPDPQWPGMYRVVLADRSVSDMVNLTRAKDAWPQRERGRAVKSEER
jgi:hypothetical protein